MNKTAIKNFAIWARNKLIADIQYRAGLMGITTKGIQEPLPQSTSSVEFYDIGTTEPYSIVGQAIQQRKRLASIIRQKEKDSDYSTAYKYILEEVAYTWFNRLIAIRFMEVNDYLPSHIRVLSSESGKVEPDLVTIPFDSGLDFTSDEEQEVLQLKNDNKLDEAFRLLFIKQCNALNKILPALFEQTSDYTELLLSLSVVDQDGVVYRLVHDIDEDDFNIEKGGQVEIIGWLYQYYNTEPKNAAFAKNGKITKDEIPAVTQLFTPDWIVRYMVQNSLGRIFIDKRKNEGVFADGRSPVEMTWEETEEKRIANEEFIAEQMGWKYYLPEAVQTKEVREQLDKIQRQNEHKDVRDIKVIDPCMGSGHILVYAFDVLMQMYEDAGYSQRDAAKSILENNLYGLDIDDRAYQLAYFAVMMKARQYNRRILNGETTCHVYAIQESNNINRIHLKYLGAGMDDLEVNTARVQLEGLLDTLRDAKEYGSILKVENYNWELLRRFVSAADAGEQITMDSAGLEMTTEQLLTLIHIAETMERKYDVVVTNPPYMGSSGMDEKLSEFVKANYSDAKSDMSTVFMEKTLQICDFTGYIAMINIPVWMFLSSFESMRRRLLNEKQIINMLHFGRGVFGSDFGTTAFVIKPYRIKGFSASYRRLFKKQGAVDSLNTKEKWFFSGIGAYSATQEGFEQIDGSPIAYWANDRIRSAFQHGKPMSIVAPPKQGSTTGCNDLFLRLWFEVCKNKEKWFPCLKGGAFRKWYGNHDYVIDWENNGAKMIAVGRQTIRNADKLFCEGISWSRVTIGASSFRLMEKGFFFESASGVCFPAESNRNYILGLLNSKVIQAIAEMLNPTATLQSGDLARVPVLIEKQVSSLVDQMVAQNIGFSKSDWDSYETSWDFKKHPMMRLRMAGAYAWGDTPPVMRLSSAYKAWKLECDGRFQNLKANEEELNRIFIDIYGLQDELTPDVADKDVTVHRIFDTKDDVPESMQGSSYVRTKRDEIVSLLSYAVGCMFGRYSLDVEGLAYAGGAWDAGKYTSFVPDKDGIIPITDEDYLEDDIIARLCDWLKAVYGSDTLEANLDFIAKALGGKGNSSREIIRGYFLRDFYKDHCKAYQKRPIYWLFDSGKQNGFKALIYLHRYTPDTIGNLRVDYLHKMQRVYESEIGRMQDMIDHSTSSREVAASTKRKEKLQKQLKECRDYDEKIAHLALSRIALDLDDGVKVNYRKVQTATDGKFYEVLADSKNIMGKEKNS